MKTKPSTERQRKLVALRKSEGMKRIEVWSYPDLEGVIREFIRYCHLHRIPPNKEETT